MPAAGAALAREQAANSKDLAAAKLAEYKSEPEPKSGGKLKKFLIISGLLAVGGLLYTLGGVTYGIRKPNPWPATFGYHEVFHAMTIVAAICHYIAVYFAVYNSPYL